MVAGEAALRIDGRVLMLGRSLWLGAWIIGGVTWLGFSLRWWSGDHFLVTRLVNYFMPWFLLLLAPLFLLAFYSQRRGLALFLVLPIIAVVVTYAPLFLPVLPGRTAVAAPTQAPVVKVMTYNVWSRNQRIDAMAGTILDQRPDIVLLQEIDGDQLARLLPALRPLAPDGLHVSHEPRLLQAVISRFPIERLEAIRHKGQAQIVRLQLPAGPVTIFNVHPLRRGGWQYRHRQIAALLAEEIAATNGPLLLGGDFNTTDQTQMYRQVTRYLRDAHWVAGVGFGFTFPTPNARLLGAVPLPPLVRIDHLFCSEHFEPLAAGTVRDAGGSDHFPVVATLRFPPRDPSR